MSRPYHSGRRRAAAEETRSRVVAAARELLTGSGAIGGFSIDAVANQAGVARMTVYYQFGSKRGLLEALFDDLAERSLVSRLLPAFAQADPRAALDALVAAFAGFWTSERVVIRRLRALAALDPELDEAIRARDERRRGGLRTTLGRFLPDPSEDLVALLHTLTSFETFDNLAGPTRSPEEVLPAVSRLVCAAIGLEAEPKG
jgi:AcrR family transcriptional regulator